jgi:uncharacterized protein (DUF1330 family)
MTGAGKPGANKETVMADAATTVGKGYIYVEMTIHDPERFKDYRQLSAPAVHAAGGWYAVAGARPQVLEGCCDFHRIVLVAFASVERACAF